ncbi:hypothetical protein HRI96_07150 [Treponema parvum]|uniref:Uncharacterized protein n=1 Tax=Treponema parvum TaxID=138851 RepID=A0A975F046_9SPIR|nr:hypothetical protein [Treponema parvum]QTQ11987.1 hypothetical protein HRI96_07150 [Treponema parvum]
MKKNIFLFSIFFVVFFLCSFAYAVTETSSIADGPTADSIQDDRNDFDSAFDDLDSVFEDANDVSGAVVSEKDNMKTGVNQFALPLNFSGYMKAEIGLGYVNENKENDMQAGVDFLNDLSFSVRPDNTLFLKATLRTKFPDEKEPSQWNFSLYEMYFDYVLLNNIYVTAGKKTTVWGAVRLFNNRDDYEDDEDALFTNILADSRDGASAQIRVPVGNWMLNGFALYKGASDDASYKSMSLAASLEMVFGYTSFTLFARKFPAQNSPIVISGKDEYKDSLTGAEIKRTILGFDIYAQQIAFLGDYPLLKDLSKNVFSGRQIRSSDLSGFSKTVFTGGIYRFWDTAGPALGFNIEFQDVYLPEKHAHTGKLAYRGGISRLGKSKNITFGLSGKHVFQRTQGELEPGIAISGIFPHAVWKNGVKIEYGGEYDDPLKFTVGTSILLQLHY